MPASRKIMGVGRGQITKIINSDNFYTTAGTLGVDNILTGSLANTSAIWTADLSSIAGSNNPAAGWISGTFVSGATFTSIIPTQDTTKVGIGLDYLTEDPSEALHLNGRMFLDNTSVPSDTVNKLYANSGNLYFGASRLLSGAAGSSGEFIFNNSGVYEGNPNVTTAGGLSLTAGNLTVQPNVGNASIHLSGSLKVSGTSTFRPTGTGDNTANFHSPIDDGSNGSVNLRFYPDNGTGDNPHMVASGQRFSWGTRNGGTHVAAPTSEHLVYDYGTDEVWIGGKLRFDAPEYLISSSGDSLKLTAADDKIELVSGSTSFLTFEKQGAQVTEIYSDVSDAYLRFKEPVQLRSMSTEKAYIEFLGAASAASIGKIREVSGDLHISSSSDLILDADNIYLHDDASTRGQIKLTSTSLELESAAGAGIKLDTDNAVTIEHVNGVSFVPSNTGDNLAGIYSYGGGAYRPGFLNLPWYGVGGTFPYATHTTEINSSGTLYIGNYLETQFVASSSARAFEAGSPQLYISGTALVSGSVRLPSAQDVTTSPGANYLWASGTNLYWDDEQLDTAGSATSLLTAGYVPYASGSSKILRDSVLYNDIANSRIGINTASPNRAFDVRGTSLLSGNTKVVGTGEITSTLDVGSSITGTGTATFKTASLTNIVLDPTNRAAFIKLQDSSRTTTTASRNPELLLNQILIDSGSDKADFPTIRFTKAGPVDISSSYTNLGYRIYVSGETGAGTVDAPQAMIWDFNSDTSDPLNYTEKLALTTAGGLRINNAYTLPTAAPASNGYVITGATDGTTAWVANSGGGGGGTISGSIADNQIAIGASASDSIEGSANLTYDANDIKLGTADTNQNIYLEIAASGAGYTAAGIKLLTYNGANRPGGVYSYNHANTAGWYSGPLYGTSFKWGISYKSSLTDTDGSLESTADDGNAVLQIGTDGKVGIGDVSAGSKLHISGNTDYNNTGGIRLGTTSTYASIYINNSSGGLEIDSPHSMILDANRHMEFHAGGTTREHRFMYATTQYGFMTTADANTYWAIGNKSIASAGLLLSGAAGGIRMVPADGNVTVVGTISATAKSFDIPHPDKEGMRLIHGSLEGPEHGVYVRGTAKGHGDTTIELPDYWKTLVGNDYTLQLTSYNSSNVYIIEKDETSFTIGSNSLNYKFDYFVIGKREEIEVEIDGN